VSTKRPAKKSPIRASRVRQEIFKVGLPPEWKVKAEERARASGKAASEWARDVLIRELKKPETE
jgi:hypothetical protein